MARVPITVMGYRCDRCEYEWIPRRDSARDPKVCPNPKCKSPYWNTPRKASPMTYEHFRDTIHAALRDADGPLTWTELRTAKRLPQAFPNNRWVHKMEEDIGLQRQRDSHGIIRWSLR